MRRRVTFRGQDELWCADPPIRSLIPQGVPQMNIRTLLGALVASALLFTMPVPTAHADTYPPQTVGQDFAGSPGGWSQSSEYAGLCIQALVCPAVSNSWSGGGADGNGYVRTQFQSVATTAAGTSTGIWQSP